MTSEIVEKNTEIQRLISERESEKETKVYKIGKKYKNHKILQYI